MDDEYGRAVQGSLFGAYQMRSMDAQAVGMMLFILAGIVLVILAL